jgi:hypothetical protein
VGVVGAGPVADTVRVSASDHGAEVIDDAAFDTEADALFVAGKAGLVDHEVAETMKTKLVVPLTAVPVTSKAYAAFRRNEVMYVPDFIALAAPLLAAVDADGGDPDDRIRQSMDEIKGEGPNAWLLAIGRAEAFLSTWQDAPPFGRPLAS